MSAIFLAPLRFPDAALTGDTSAVGPLANVLRDHLGSVWSSTAAAPSLTLRVDGAAINSLALWRTNMTAADSVRMRFSMNADGSSPIYEQTLAGAENVIAFFSPLETPAISPAIVKSGTSYSNTVNNGSSNYASYIYGRSKTVGASFSFYPNQTEKQMCIALSYTPESNPASPWYPAMDYMVYLNPTGQLDAYYRGTAIAPGVASYTSNDRIGMEHRGTTVVLLKNGSVVYTFNGVPSAAMMTYDIRMADTASIRELTYYTGAGVGTISATYLRLDFNRSSSAVTEVARLIVGKRLEAEGISKDAEVSYDDQSVRYSGPNWFAIDDYSVLKTWKVRVEGLTEDDWFADGGWHDFIMAVGEKRPFVFLPYYPTPYLNKLAAFGAMTSPPRETWITQVDRAVEMGFQTVP